MKKFTFALVILSLVIRIFAQEGRSYKPNVESELQAYSFQRGIHYRILDGIVNIRSEPNLNGAVVGRLNIHDRILIVENTNIEQKIDGFLAYWYKIDFNNTIGYIWGGYIAANTFIIEDFYNNPQEKLYIYNRYTFRGEDDYDFDLRYDVFIYRDLKRIILPPNTTLTNAWGDMIFKFSDYDLYIINGELNLFFNCWNPGSYYVCRYSLNNNNMVTVQNDNNSRKLHRTSNIRTFSLLTN